MPIFERLPHNFGGSRKRAALLRAELEEQLDEHTRVTVDFSGVEVTQSFVDELVGVLVLRDGPAILKRLTFKGCSRDVQALLRFVCQTRANDFLGQAPHPH